MKPWRQWLLAVLLGALGFVAAWGTWHLYLDHANFHALLQWAVQQQAPQAPSRYQPPTDLPPRPPKEVPR